MGVGRKALTIRINQEEERDLVEVCKYYRMQPKQIMKLALGLLVESTNQMKKTQEKKNEEEKLQSDGDALTAGADSTGTEHVPGNDIQ